MAVPTSRNTFKEWCLRKLGKPVIEINVDDDQVEDRIDEAILMVQKRHTTNIRLQIKTNQTATSLYPRISSALSTSSIYHRVSQHLQACSMSNISLC